MENRPLHIASSNAFVNLLIYYQQEHPLPEAQASFPIQLPSLHWLKPHAHHQASLGQEKRAHLSEVETESSLGEGWGTLGAWMHPLILQVLDPWGPLK